MRTQLLTLIVFLIFIPNLDAQVRKIIFPDNRKVSHEDSMRIIMIDHYYNCRRQEAIEMLEKGKVSGNVRDINGFYAIEYAMEYFDTNFTPY